MAGKRSATSELNHDNWDRDEEPEDSGMFQRAPEDSLKKRIIKTARRRNPISSVRNPDDRDEKKSAFTGFTAFSKASTPAAPTFAFLSNLTSQKDQPKTNGLSGSTEEPQKKTESVFPTFVSSANILSSNSCLGTNNSTNGETNDYYSKLKGLNESVSKWIKKHVDANPLINLQPIFKDYEKYFKDLEKENEPKSIFSEQKLDANKKVENIPIITNSMFKSPDKVADSSNLKTVTETSKTEEIKSSMFTFRSVPTPSNFGSTPSFGFSSTATSNTFSFVASNTSTTTTSTPSSLSFGSSTSGGYKFSSSTPISFGSVPEKASATVEADKEDEEDVPKVEFTPVIEKDHIYTTRCKVFVKKDDKYGDRGVGNLFLKPIDNSEKVQLIVRADTNLGNLLCNFILSESIPTKRMGKKDVMLVCLPTPDFKPPPVPILLRVKSPEDADKLLETLDKHRK